MRQSPVLANEQQQTNCAINQYERKEQELIIKKEVKEQQALHVLSSSYAKATSALNCLLIIIYSWALLMHVLKRRFLHIAISLSIPLLSPVCLDFICSIPTLAPTYVRTYVLCTMSAWQWSDCNYSTKKAEVGYCSFGRGKILIFSFIFSCVRQKIFFLI